MHNSDSPKHSIQRLFIPSVIVAIGVILLLAGLRAATRPYAELNVFLALFVELDWLPSILAALAIVGALSRPAQRAGWLLANLLARHARFRTPLATFIGLAVLALVVYRCHPLSMDEYIVVFQSRVFAAGKLTGVFPIAFIDALIPVEFQNSFLVVSKDTGRVASIYLPGLSLLLTPFSKMGVPWLLNPLVGGASLYVIDRLSCAMQFSDRQRGVALLLTLSASAFVVNAISFYSMASHALLNATYALLLLKPTRKHCVLAGLVGSFALVLHNPVPHTLFAAPWLLWLAIRNDRWSTLPPIALSYLPLFVLLGPGWNAFTGTLRPSEVQPAIGDDVVKQWLLAFSTLLKWPSTDLLMARIIALAKLWIWCVPAMIVAAWLGTKEQWKQTPVRLMSLSVISTFVGYLFVIYTQGHGWGFRYLHSAWLMLPILAAASVPSKSCDPQRSGRDSGDYLAGVAALTALITLPVQLALVGSYMKNHLQQLPPAGRTDVLVLVEPNGGYYSRDLVQNDPFLRNRPVLGVRLTPDLTASLAKSLDPRAVRVSGDSRGEVWGSGSDRP